MSFITNTEYRLTRWTPDWLVSAFLRAGLAVPFWKAGLTKWQGLGRLSEGTVQMFTQEYKMHILGKTYDYPMPFVLAHVVGVAEILLPILLALGLFGRLAAFGLLIMTVFIQLTIPAGWPLHLSWAAMALAILVLGAGRLSLDALWRKV